MSTAADAAACKKGYWLRKLHSLSGIVPVGLFMCFHLFENSSAANGPEAFDETVKKINSMPFVLGLEVGVIWIPILFHTILGFAIIFEGRPNVGSYGYGRNWLYLLQRITGILAFVFIAFHFANFRMRKSEFELAPFDDVAHVLSTPWVFWLYLVGLAACIFHFANGIAGFLFSWGFIVGPRAKRLAGYACTGVGAGVFALSMRALFAFV